MTAESDKDIPIQDIYKWYEPDINYRIPITNKALLVFQKVPKLPLRAKIVELWIDGMQCIDIAVELHIDATMVSQAITRYLAKPDFDIRLESAV